MRAFGKVSTQFFVVIVAMSVVSAVILTFSSQYLGRQILEEVAKIHSKDHRAALISEWEKWAKSSTGSLAERSLQPLATLDIYTLNGMARALLRDEDIVDVLILDPEGRVLADGSLDMVSVGSTLSDSLTLKMIAVRELSIWHQPERIDIAAPVMLGEKNLGTVRVGFSRERISESIAADINQVDAGIDAATARTWRGLLILILGVMALFMVAAFAISRIIAQPIEELTRAARQIGAGHFDYRAPVRREGELGQLAAAFNAMAENLLKTTVSRDYVDNILASMTDALMVVSPQGVIRTVNQGALDLLGYTEEELLNRPVGMVIEEEEKENEVSTLKGEGLTGLIRMGFVANVEKTFKHKDGRRIPVLFSSSVMRGDEGEVQGIVCAASDISKRKAAEQALMESELRFRTIFDGAIDGILLADLEQRQFVMANPAMCRMLGYTQDEIITVGIADIHPAADLPWVAELIEKQISRVNPLAEDIPVLRKDGSVFYADVHSVPVSLKGGAALMGVFRDITQRKEAEQAVKESETQLRDAQRLAHLGSWTLDLATKKLRWSDEAFRIFEVEPDAAEITYESFLNVVHPDDREFVDRAFRESVENYTPYDIEHRLLMKDGRVKWINERGRTEYDEQGAPVRATGTALDITDRKSADIKLQESMQKLELFRQTIDQSSDAFFVTDIKTGRFIDVNETASAMLGYSRKELLDMKVTGIEVEFPDDFSWDQYVEAVRQSEGEVFRGRTLRKDGSTFPNEVSVKVVSLNHHEVIIAILRDVSERIETERALRYAQKVDSLGNLAGGIAHNMNNLLLPILSLTDMTLKDLPEGSRARKRLEKVAQAAAQGKDLVQQIMDFSRSSTDDDRAEEHDVHDVVVGALDLVMVSVPSSINVVQDLGASGLRADIDQDEITTVIMNVVSNAVDAFNGKVGRITISLMEEEVDARTASRIPGLHPGHYAKLTVADTGKGMDEITLERMFDPFFTTKEVGEGKGLGLATVHSIVQKHQGVISISSMPDVGTTVVIYLPTVGDAPSSQS